MSDEPAKPASGYAPANTGPNGAYIVGRGKPPESGKFREGDGRKRGRRTKGTQNLLTDFAEEMAAMVSVAVDGKPKRVTRQRSIVMRTVHDASRGDPKARQAVMQLAQRGQITVESGAEPAEPVLRLPCLADLSDEELRTLDRLIHKAEGKEYIPYKADDPLAYCRDPDDERNYYTERTLEGLIYRRCKIDTIADELIGMENRAYISAALPRRPGCYPGHVTGTS